MPYALVLLVVIPCVALAALYVAELHAGARAQMEQTARWSAKFAAAGIDREMLGLVRTLKALPPVSLRSAKERNALYARADAAFENIGITFFARNRALELLAPADAVPVDIATPDAAARSATAKAFSTHRPRASPYRNAADEFTTSINLWLAAVAEDSTLVVLQLRIPSSLFKAMLKQVVAGSLSTITLRDSAGDIIARSDEPDGARFASPQDETIESFAEIPRFGWHVAVTMPLASLKASEERNWISFFLVTSLITGVASALAMLLSRRILEPDYASSRPTRIAPDSSAPGFHPQDRSYGRMLMPHAENAFRKRGREQQPQPDENRLRLALGSGGVGAWQWDIGARFVEWDSTLASLLKASPDEPQGAKALIKRIDPNDRGRLLQAVRNALTKGQPLAVDIRVRCFDGRERWFAVRGTATKSEDQEPCGLVGIAHDITDQKQSLSRTDALLREVSHRSKNMLALILAMARLTARDAVDVKSHLKEFALRVAGLAASQDLIVAADWQSVDLGALAVAQVDAVARTGAARVTISGPSFAVTPEAAQTVGMILAELTLNAVQHGALSVPTGEVRLSWEFPDDSTITISWQEIGGPGFDPERPSGYGMSVVERFSTHGLKASAHAGGNAAGFVWVLNAPLAGLGTRPPPHRA